MPVTLTIERLSLLELGQSQVQHLDLALGIEHQVRGLDVPVHESMLLRALQAQRRLTGHFAGVRDAQRATPRHDLRQIQSVDVFHHQEPDPVHLPRIGARTMWGWSSRPTASISRSNRATASVFPRRFWGNTLSATTRLSRTCCA